jgi:hypothetical protein
VVLDAAVDEDQLGGGDLCRCWIRRAIDGGDEVEAGEAGELRTLIDLTLPTSTVDAC